MAARDAQPYPGLHARAGARGVGIGFTSIGGPLTLAVALVLNAMFLHGAWRSGAGMRTAIADSYAVEKRFFRFSLAICSCTFGALLAEAALKPFGLGGW
jgi:heme o synthase